PERASLLSSKKKRVVIESIEGSIITKEDLVIERTDCNEEEVEGGSSIILSTYMSFDLSRNLMS
ncbi:unnamed protein product, partial [Cylicocyclus nassatus]